MGRRPVLPYSSEYVPAQPRRPPVTSGGDQSLTQIRLTARIFNTYGPRLHPSDGRVIFNFMMQALRGEPLTIYGDGSQTRSFCYVDDLVQGIVLLARSDEHLPVNLGNPEEYTILECARAVLDATGSKSELIFVDLPEDDPTRRRPDITKARTLLGWGPRVGLREGLQKSLDFFRSKAVAGAAAESR
jgi:dTDP-glucose 4,6-dehydratase